MGNRIKFVGLIAVIVLSLAAFGAVAQDATAVPTLEPTSDVTLEPTLEATVDATADVTLEPTLEATLETTADTVAATEPAMIDPTATIVGTQMVVFGSASLQDVSGAGVGSVVFTTLEDGKVLVTANFIDLPPGFHGFHIHTTGVCDAADGFKSAGGHFDREDASHPDHDGDLPSLLVNSDGSAMLTFSTDRFTVADLFDADGSAVMLHSGEDNFANIPARYGSDPMAVTPDPAKPAASIADEDTLRAGDSGERLACGVIEEGFMAILPTVDSAAATPADSPDMAATSIPNVTAVPDATDDPIATIEPTSDLPTLDPAITATVDPDATGMPGLTPEPTQGTGIPIDPPATEVKQ